MQAGGTEEEMIRLQLSRRMSIFACNYAAVISTVKVNLGLLAGTPVYTWVNPLPEGGSGPGDPYLNTYTFLMAWDTLMNSGQVWPFDFVVKVDPDTVFFPSRLREHVSDHVGRVVYFPNCGMGAGTITLLGSLEVVSSVRWTGRQAIV